MRAIPHWFWPGDDRPTDQIDDEIAEELRLHLDLLAEEHQRRGLAPEEAQQKAAERFGDFDDLLRRCRREKQGDVVMLKRVQVALMVLLLLGTVAVGLQQWQTSLLMQDIDVRLNDLSGIVSIDQSFGPVTGNTGVLQSRSRPPFGCHQRFGDSSLAVRVVDERGKPIPEALLLYDVCSIRPSEQTVGYGRGTTDKQGVGHFGFVRGSSIVAYGAIAGAPGYVPIHKQRDAEKPEEIVIELPKPSARRLVLRNADGAPTPRVRIAPVGRIGEDGVAVPFTAVEPTPSEKADDEGRVTIEWFSPGDEAYIEARLPLDDNTYEGAFEMLGDDETEIDVVLRRVEGQVRGGGQF